MKTEAFNTKYKQYLEHRHYGLDIYNEEVADYLDTMFETVLTKLPDFTYSQIKVKLGSVRLYCTGVDYSLVTLIEITIKWILDKHKRQLDAAEIKKFTGYSDVVLQHIVDNTTIEQVDVYRYCGSLPTITDLGRYLQYIENQDTFEAFVVANEPCKNDLRLTRFNVGDSVYAYNEYQGKLKQYTITDIQHTTASFDKTTYVSIVSLQAGEDDHESVYNNNTLFSSKEDFISKVI